MANIDPEKKYSLNEIVKLGIMGNTHPTVLKRVLEDKLGDDVLQVERAGSEKARRYYIKGMNIAAYLKK